MYITERLLILILFVHTYPCFGYEEEVLKLETKNGIWKLVYDFQNGNVKDNVLEYFPNEIEELLDLVEKYFMGKHGGYSRSKRTIDLTCVGCEVIVDVLKEIFAIGIPDEIIIPVATKLCSLALDESVCHGMAKTLLPDLRYIAEHHAMDGGQFCALALGGKCGNWEDIYEWEIDFPDATPKPPFVEPKEPSVNMPTTNVLHISDVHLDLSYKVGTNVDCGMPMCCMNFTEMANETSKGAGYWGEYYCDTPVWTFEDMLSQIKEEYSDAIDYIMFTGDFPAHDVWLQSRENNIQHGKVATDLVKKYFPDSIVLPNIGNHEPFPINSLAIPSVKDPEFSASWIYDYLGDQFSSWLPEEAKVTFNESGFFTYKLLPGLRIVSLNSILNLGYNFYTNLNYKDPGDSLLRLWNVLLEAEENSEKVHIIGHSPPNTKEYISGWAKHFTKIIDRFANTVTGQFYGHTHNDEFTMFYDYETNQIPVNIAFVTPSVTTFTGLNPSFRFYKLDGPYEGASMRVIDIDTYIFNLTEANEKGESTSPKYFKLYNHKKDLEMKSVFPKDFDELANRMATNDTIYDKFFRYFNSDSWGHNFEKREVICKMVSSVYIDERKCDEIMG